MIQSPAGYQGDVRIKRYLDFYQAGYGVAMLSSGTTAFTPASLFAASEPGGWYDPSDLTTLYQDASGTTPVTAVEQPVGLVLDKSRGLVRGPEIVPASYSGSTSGAWAISTTQVTRNGSTTGQASFALSSSPVTGGRYVITFQVESFSGDETIFRLGATSGSFYRVAANGTYTAVVSAVGTASAVYFAPYAGTAGQITITSVSVRELPGAHLSQSTAAARPVLSARVNLLTYTEGFSTSDWLKLNVGSGNVTPDATAAPDGTLTADKLHVNTTNGAHGVYRSGTVLANAAGRLSVCAKAAELSWIALTDTQGNGSYFNISAGSVGSAIGSGNSATVASLGNGWFRCTVLTPAIANASYGVYAANGDGGVSFAGANNSDGVFIWGADLRPANAGVGLPSYQRVGAATDYDTTGFPLYLKFDGTDDFLQSSTITPGADKAQVFAGVRKLSDTVAVLAELSANANINNGSFFIATGTANNYTAGYSSGSRGTAGGITAAQCGGIASLTAPHTAVLGITHDIAGDLSTLNANQTAGTNGTADKGSGNFGAYPLYVGGRFNAPPSTPTALLFGGHLYSLILRFSAANLDAATITATETWVNGKTRAF